MEQQYNEMCTALEAAMNNLPKIRTMDQLLKESALGLAEGASTVVLMYQSLAISDAIARMNQLNQFLDLPKLSLDGDQKIQFVQGASMLVKNRDAYVQTLSTIIATKVGYRPNDEPFKLDTIIADILLDITKSARMLSANPRARA